MEHVPVQDRTRLVSDHGSSYLARAFEDYLRMLAVRHICCYYSPHHPQSNGKLERFHETLNARVNLVVYTGPDQLRAAMAGYAKWPPAFAQMPTDRFSHFSGPIVDIWLYGLFAPGISKHNATTHY